MDKQLFALFTLQNAIREFFKGQTFLEVLTPPMVQNPGMETHIHPFKVQGMQLENKCKPYLHTSPEFHMKELLSKGFKNIFTLSYCFRNEPESSTHRPQFVMLEWYRSKERYEKIMSDCEGLIQHSIQSLKKADVSILESYENFSLQKKTIQEIFFDFLNIDIMSFLDSDKLKSYIKENHSDINLPKEELSWDDYYFLLFLNKIEPKLKDYPAILLYEFPHHLSALSTIKEGDPRVCERFEIYLNGIELCNCFNELTDLTIQKERFKQQHDDKKELYGYELPEASVLYQALERGLPQSAGIALGVERLLMALTGMDNPFWD